MSTAASSQVRKKVVLAESVLGHTFADKALVRRALTHPSAVENSPEASYERLEFLGDSLIGAMVAEEVFNRFPHLHEGGMTRVKISLVAGPVLSSVAQRLGLEEAVIYGENRITGRGRITALENIYEALTAALYLDAGLDVARSWVLRTLGPLISEDVALTHENPKSELQELVQAAGDTPRYRIASHEGPPHDRLFTAIVEIGGEVAGEGTGQSKREAEAAAAAAALEALKG